MEDSLPPNPELDLRPGEGMLLKFLIRYVWRLLLTSCAARFVVLHPLGLPNAAIGAVGPLLKRGLEMGGWLMAGWLMVGEEMFCAEMFCAAQEDGLIAGLEAHSFSLDWFGILLSWEMGLFCRLVPRPGP